MNDKFKIQFASLHYEYVNLKFRLGILIHVFNPSAWEAEVGGLQVQSQIGHSEELHKKTVELSVHFLCCSSVYNSDRNF